MNINQKIKLFNILVISFFIIAIARTFQLQLINGQYYQRLSFKQSYSLQKIEPSRGLIYSSDRVPLVTNQTLYQVSIYKPNLKIDQSQLVQILPKEKTIENFFNNPNQKWITLNTYISPEETTNLKKVDGLSLKPVEVRFYPEVDLAKEVTGFVNKDSFGFLTGYDGLEGYYNQRLSGKSGFIWQTKDAMGNPVLSHLNWSKPKINGFDLVTSLNRVVQNIVEEELQVALNNLQAESVSAVIMNTSTGAIISMSTKDATSSAYPKNRVVTDIFEPGSIFKPITLSIGLDSKSIDNHFICHQCDQNRMIDGHQIKNWNNQNHPNSSLGDIIRNSDNIGMTYIMDEINFDTFFSYATKLNLRQKTGIDLQGEARPQFDRQYWSSLDKATASFGQGFAISPIQAVSAFNSIANDGLYIKPSLVSPFRKMHQTTVFRKETTDFVKQLLENNINSSNLAKLNTAQLSICGKSGTAQVAASGQYGQDTIASFVAFTPCQRPKYTMLITVKHPQTSIWAEATAAPVWFSIALKIDPFI